MNDRFNNETFIDDEEPVQTDGISWLLRLSAMIVISLVITDQVYVEDETLTRLGNLVFRSVTSILIIIGVAIIMAYIEALFKSARPK